VCTKGCNQLIKVKKPSVKAAAGTDESKIFNAVVCQTDKRVHCRPKSKDGKTVCTTKKWIDPVAVCDYVGDLWNLGGTCIANHLQKEPYPDCPPAAPALLNTIPGACRLARRKSDANACQPLAVTF
jgi:hypothetical protein